MPKSGKDFSEKVSTNVSTDTMADLISISFQTGNGKNYGFALRMMLTDAIRLYKGSLDKPKRRDFDEIRRNALIMLLRRKPSRGERLGTEAAESEVKEPTDDLESLDPLEVDEPTGDLEPLEVDKPIDGLEPPDPLEALS